MQPVFLVAAIRPTLSSGATEFFHEVTACANVIDRFVHKDVMQPELRLVIPDRLLALKAVGDIDVWKAVIVEIERAASPGPAGAGNGITQGRLFEAAVGLSKTKPISKGHRRSSQAILSRVETPQAQMLQAVHSWRGHSDHQQVEPAIGVEIRQRVGHAEAMRLGHRLAGHVGEVAAAVILVKVKAGKITHDHQAKVAIAVEVRERGAVNAPPAFLA